MFATPPLPGFRNRHEDVRRASCGRCVGIVLVRITGKETRLRGTHSVIIGFIRFQVMSRVCRPRITVLASVAEGGKVNRRYSYCLLDVDFLSGGSHALCSTRPEAEDSEL